MNHLPAPHWAVRFAYGLVGLCSMLAGPAALAANELVFAVAGLPLSLPAYVAQAEGYFKAESVAVRVVDCPIGRVCLKRLLDGQADLATVADLPIVLASFGSDRFAILATIGTNRNDTKIITRTGSGIDSVADLSGRKVGTLVGTSAHYFLDLVNLRAGVDPARVALMPLSPDTASTALQSGQVDAVAVFEPYAHATVRGLGREARVFTDKRAYTQTWNVVASRSVTGARDHELEAVLRALDRAVQLILREPSRAKAVLRSRLGYNDAAIEWIWPDIVYEIGLEQSLLNTLEGQARWALRGGYASGRAPNYLQFIHPGPLERARPGAVTIVR